MQNRSRIPIPPTPLGDYVGDYEHQAYGILKVGLKDGELQFHFGKIQLSISHFHYDRFDTPDDERAGKWSVNFLTNPTGDVDKVMMSLDQAEVTFTRRAETLDLRILTQLAGTYETPTGFKFQVVLKKDDSLHLVTQGQPEDKLIPYKGLIFRIQRFSDVTFEFFVENEKVKALKQRDPSGEYEFVRR